MENNKSIVLLSVVLAVAVLVLGFVAFMQKPPVVNVTVNVSNNDDVKEETPVVVSRDANGGAVGKVTVSGGVEPSFGANSWETTEWISGSFTDDLTVTDSVTVGNDLTLRGDLVSTSTPQLKSQAFTSSGSSQSLCSIQLTEAATILDVGLEFATDTATGGINWFTVSQSTTANATGTGANLYADTQLESPTNGLTNLLTTSTFRGSSAVYDTWDANSYVNFLIASPTSTLTGKCQVLYAR